MESLDIDILMLESVVLHCLQWSSICCSWKTSLSQTLGGKKKHNYEYQMNYAIEFMKILHLVMNQVHQCLHKFRIYFLKSSIVYWQDGIGQQFQV